MSLRARFYNAAAQLGLINIDHHLQHAACRGYPAAVKSLLEAGANLHSNDDLALRLASSFGRTHIVEILLAAGADVHAGNDGPLRWAKEARRIETVRTLEEWIASEPIRELTSPKRN